MRVKNNESFFNYTKRERESRVCQREKDHVLASMGECVIERERERQMKLAKGF